MTEQDAAMVDYQAATLAARHIALWISAAALVVSAAVGGAQCILIWRGLRMMDRSNRARAEAVENQRRESDQRHAEAMAALADQRRATDDQRRALDAMIEEQRAAREDQRRATDDQRRTLEAMIEEQRAAREDQRRALDAMIEGQRALIERTAPREPEDR